MKKTYKTDNNTLLIKVGRVKKVFYNTSGDPYFMWGGRREKFYNIPRLSYPLFYTDENGKKGHCGGYIPLCNFGGVLVEILDGGEAVQLWNEIDLAGV